MFAQLIYRGKRIYHFFKTGLLKGLPAEYRYGHPARKLKIIAITGTDGKTTSSTMLYHVLKTAGYRVALLSTVAAYIGDRALDTGLHVTAPDPDELNKLMAEMVREGIEFLVMETTSHGIYQYRTWGVKPLVAGLTNINYEHLDYHLNYQNYVEAKALLLTNAKLTVINDDDYSAPFVKKILREHKQPYITYGLQDTLPPSIKAAINERFDEAYNHSNARLVTAIAQQFNLTNKQIIRGITTFVGIPGRMELVIEKPFTVIVDFAHTPQGLEAALTSLRQRLNQQSKKGKLIAIFGCAGLRDRQKRPKMGKIGADLADLAVFSAEDPRTEDIWSIIRQMKEQLTTGHNKIISIPDRKAAITFALTKLAQPGDLVGIFGKGHEQSLCYGTIEYPWDDRAVVREIMKVN